MNGPMSRRSFVKLGVAGAAVVALGGGAYVAMAAPEAEQPRWRMGAGVKKVLVVYGTGSGCTAGVAERIGRSIAAGDATVEVAAAKDAPAATGFDAVFVGSGVRGGTWHQPVKDWVKANAPSLAGGNVAFYTVGLTLASDPGKVAEVRAYTDPLIAETGVHPMDVGTFAGWNEPKRFSFVERTILKLMKAPEGDFRDRDDIDQWTTVTAGRLGVGACCG